MIRWSLLIAIFGLVIYAIPVLGDTKVEWDVAVVSGISQSGLAFAWETGFNTSGEWSLGEKASFVLRDKLARDSKNEEWSGTLGRCYLKYETGPFRLNIGRQAVSWGVGWFFRPTDIITPLTPLAKDENRPGKDCVSLRISTSPLTAIDILAGEKLVAARSEWRLGETNLRLLGVWQTDGVNIIGADFQGGLMGLYGESAFKWDGNHDFESGKWVTLFGLKRIVGKDRLWFLEFLRDNSGEANPEDYNYLLLSGGDRFYLGQDYIATGIEIPWDELTSFTIGAVANIDDGGMLLNGQANWLLTDNLDLNLGLGFLTGGDQTEFTTEANGSKISLNLAAKYYF